MRLTADSKLTTSVSVNGFLTRVTTDPVIPPPHELNKQIGLYL